MRVGISTIFSFRPHVEHAVYAGRLLEDAGHQTYGLTCDAAVAHCYSRDLRGFGRLRGCSTCISGGLHSYAVPRVSTIRRSIRAPLDAATLHRLTVSSVAVRFRTEPSSELLMPEFLQAQEALRAPVEVVYGNAKRWIEQNRLDAVLCFNGRMDLTAAIVAACESMDVPYVTLERPWFGHGLHLVPGGNCLSLGWIGHFCDAYANLPLTREQVRVVGRMAAERFLQRNVLEWRVYNPDSQRVAWPGSGNGRRILILPSSRNEFEGHPDRMCSWPDYTWAIDRVLDEAGISGDDCVLRCHPSWAEKVGRNTGWRCEQHYRQWGLRREIKIIPSADTASTYDLINAADVVVVNGSSAGMEAALRGKQVISVGHCAWERAGFSIQIHTEKDFEQLRQSRLHNPKLTIRAALRFMYTHARRYSQYARHVRSITTTRYEYLAGANPEQLCVALQSSKLLPDDPVTTSDDTDENAVVEMVDRGAWDELVAWDEPVSLAPRLVIGRRSGLRWVDRLRQKLPSGDRMG